MSGPNDEIGLPTQGNNRTVFSTGNRRLRQAVFVGVQLPIMRHQPEGLRHGQECGSVLVENRVWKSMV